MRQRILSGTALVLALTVLAAQPAVAEGQPWVSANDEIDPHAHHRAMMKKPAATERSRRQYEIPDIVMTDQHGAAVSLPELFATDKPVMVNFIFTTCNAICPMMSSIFQQVQKRLGDDADEILMVSVSIDPEQDTPTALAAYAEQFRAGPQWRFLTGSLEDSVAVQQAFKAYRGDKMNHAPLTLLRANENSDWLRMDGFASAADLEREVRTVL